MVVRLHLVRQDTELLRPQKFGVLISLERRLLALRHVKPTISLEGRLTRLAEVHRLVMLRREREQGVLMGGGVPGLPRREGSRLLQAISLEMIPEGCVQGGPGPDSAALSGGGGHLWWQWLWWWLW